MKTAILYSGHARTFAKCFPNHWAMVHRHFQNPHFFCSFVDDEDSDPRVFRALIERVGEDRVSFERVKQPEHIPLPAGCPDESTYRQGVPFMHEPYAISVPPQAVLRQLWHLHRVYEWFRKNNDRDEFGTVVRCRPDLWFHSFCGPQRISPVAAAAVPWWGGFGGVNDRFAVLSPKGADMYFRTFDLVVDAVERGLSLHPETLVAYALEGLFVQRIGVDFSTVRKDGTVRGPEMLASDIARGIDR